MGKWKLRSGKEFENLFVSPCSLVFALSNGNKLVIGLSLEIGEVYIVLLHL